MKHISLYGEFVRLEPLTLNHMPDLEIDFEPKLFDYYPKPYSTAREFVEENLDMQKSGTFLPYVTGFISARFPDCGGIFSASPAADRMIRSKRTTERTILSKSGRNLINSPNQRSRGGKSAPARQSFSSDGTLPDILYPTTAWPL